MAATAAPRPLQAVLDVAAAAALRAPSVLNTQPWRWIVPTRAGNWAPSTRRAAC
jgi:nitroreductase